MAQSSDNDSDLSALSVCRAQLEHERTVAARWKFAANAATTAASAMQGQIVDLEAQLRAQRNDFEYTQLQLQAWQAAARELEPDDARLAGLVFRHALHFEPNESDESDSAPWIVGGYVECTVHRPSALEAVRAARQMMASSTNSSDSAEPDGVDHVIMLNWRKRP